MLAKVTYQLKLQHKQVAVTNIWYLVQTGTKLAFFQEQWHQVSHPLKGTVVVVASSSAATSLSPLSSSILWLVDDCVNIWHQMARLTRSSSAFFVRDLHSPAAAAIPFGSRHRCRPLRKGRNTRCRRRAAPSSSAGGGERGGADGVGSIQVCGESCGGGSPAGTSVNDVAGRRQQIGRAHV